MNGGHGALLTGTYRLNKGTKLYINVGQQGTVMQADGSGGVLLLIMAVELLVDLGLALAVELHQYRLFRVLLQIRM